MAGVEQNRYKTNKECIKHLPQTGSNYSQTLSSAEPYFAILLQNYEILTDILNLHEVLE